MGSWGDLLLLLFLVGVVVVDAEGGCDCGGEVGLGL
jgi:hypothetical protein